MHVCSQRGRTRRRRRVNSESDEDFHPTEENAELGYIESYVEDTQVARAGDMPQYVSRSEVTSGAFCSGAYIITRGKVKAVAAFTAASERIKQSLDRILLWNADMCL